MQKNSSSPFSLKSYKPKPVKLVAESLVKMEPMFDSGALPLIVEPVLPDLDAYAWLEDNREMLEEKVLRHGAILFRGFGMDEAPTFERFVRSVTPNLFNENGEHPREAVEGDVYTPVFFPPEKQLLWHNENSFNHSWPLRIWFGCARPADTGGETTIVDSRLLYRKLDRKVVSTFEEKGVMYVRNYGTGLGLGWRQVFQTQDPGDVERGCRANQMRFEWRGPDQLRTTCVRPAVIPHPKTGEMSWFNQAQHFHPACLEAETRSSLEELFSEEEMPRHCHYGDGTRIEDSVMEEILGLYQELEISFPWQKGSVMMVDNVLTAHGRNAFSGPRKLLVALSDMSDYDSIGKGLA